MLTLSNETLPQHHPILYVPRPTNKTDHSPSFPSAIAPSYPHPPPMADGAEDPDEPEQEQKKEIAKWFLTHAPPGEIAYVAQDIRSLLNDDDVYHAAAEEAFPAYNKTHLLALDLPDRSGEVIVSRFGEVDECSYLDPRTAQVATVDHVKQICTRMRPADEEELPSSYVEDFRGSLDAEFCKYVGECYPKGFCAVYCTSGKDVEGPGADFEFTILVSAAKHSPQNFCNGSWRSIWNVKFADDLQVVELKGNLQVGAHYFEEGNVQLDSSHECKDSTIFQSPEDLAISITSMIRHHEAEYIASLEASYLKLPDSTFKDLRRKLPVTRTLFPWHSTLQFSLTRDIANELKIGK